jgi:hypothetical protein
MIGFDRAKKASPVGEASLLVLVVEDYRLYKRETRFERATSTLARLRSTTELHPQIKLLLTTFISIAEVMWFVNSLIEILGWREERGAGKNGSSIK